MKAIWLMWQRHRRAQEMARSLDVPLIELISTARGLARYGPLLLRTTVCLMRERPSHLFIQCPSVILGLWALLLKRPLRYRLIADLHNEAVDPFVNQSHVYRWLLRRLHRGADISIVTNKGLSTIIDANGGRPFVLPDPIPTISAAENRRPASAAHKVVFVCTFAPDEPYREVIDAARLLMGTATISITGKKPSDVLLGSLPANVQLTGYLSDAAYEQLLREADVVVDLTAMENCLVCGAYEAVALRKPLVTSDTSALRAYFTKGTVFARHDPESIAAAVETALDRRLELGLEMRVLGRELTSDWDRRKTALMGQLT